MIGLLMTTGNALAVIGPRKSLGSFSDPIVLIMKTVWLILKDALNAKSVVLVIVMLAIIKIAAIIRDYTSRRDNNGT